jgi:hypothetical protein
MSRLLKAAGKAATSVAGAAMTAASEIKEKGVGGAATSAAGLAKGAAMMMASEIKEKGVGGVVSAGASPTYRRACACACVMVHARMAVASAANEAVKSAAAEILASDWIPAAVLALDLDDAESFRAALLPDEGSLTSSGAWSLSQKLAERVGHRTRADAVADRKARRTDKAGFSWRVEAPAVLLDDLMTLAPSLALDSPATLRQLAETHGRSACVAVLDDALALSVPDVLVVERRAPSEMIFRVLSAAADGALTVAPRGVIRRDAQRVISPLLLQRYECSHDALYGIEKWGGAFVCGRCKAPIESAERLRLEHVASGRIVALDAAQFGSADSDEVSGEASVRPSIGY